MIKRTVIILFLAAVLGGFAGWGVFHYMFNEHAHALCVDRTKYSLEEHDWGLIPLFRIERTGTNLNLSVQSSGGQIHAITESELDSITTKLAAIDKSQTVCFVLNKGATLADALWAEEISKKVGLCNSRLLLLHSAPNTNGFDNYREINMSIPRTLNEHLDEWYIGREEKGVQQAVPGYPPQGVGSPEP